MATQTSVEHISPETKMPRLPNISIDVNKRKVKKNSSGSPCAELDTQRECAVDRDDDGVGLQAGGTFLSEHRRSMAYLSPRGGTEPQRPAYSGELDQQYGQVNHEAYDRLMGSPPTPVPLERDTHAQIKSKVAQPT